MAVVKTYEDRWAGEEIKVKVKCNSKGVFSIDLPPEIAEAHGSKSVTSRSLEDVERLYNATRQKYKSEKTSFRKVIAYKVDTGEGSTFKSPQARVQVKAYILFEYTTIYGSGLTHYEYLNPKEHEIRQDGREHTTIHSGGQGWGQFEGRITEPDLKDGRFRDKERQIAPLIDWTQEAEDFFNAIGAAIEGLQDRLKDFMGSPEQVEQTIASGGGNLLPSPSTKE